MASPGAALFVTKLQVGTRHLLARGGRILASSETVLRWDKGPTVIPGVGVVVVMENPTGARVLAGVVLQLEPLDDLDDARGIFDRLGKGYLGG